MCKTEINRILYSKRRDNLLTLFTLFTFVNLHVEKEKETFFSYSRKDFSKCFIDIAHFYGEDEC